MLDNFSPNELLHRFLLVTFKHKWVVVITTLAAAAAIAGGVYLIDPAYEATAMILVRSSPRPQLTLFRNMQAPQMTTSQINPAQNLVQFSTSRGIVETVAKRFGLDQEPRLEAVRDYIKYYAKKIIKSPKRPAVWVGLLEDKPRNYLAEACDRITEDYLDIQVQQDTEIIKLTIWGPTPELSQGIANALSTSLVTKTRDLLRVQAENVYVFAKDQVQVAERSLRQAEEALVGYENQEKIVSLDQERQLLLTRLEETRKAASEVSADLHEARGKVAEIHRQLDKQDPTLVSSTVDSANAVAKDLRGSIHNLSGQMEAMKTARESLHPEVVQLKAQVEELSKRLSGEAPLLKESQTTVLNPIRQDLQLQLANVETRLAALDAKAQAWGRQIDALEKQAAAFATKELTLNRLKREKLTQEDRYNQLKSKLLELEVERLTESSDFDIRIVDPAYVPENVSADYPDWELIAYLILGIAPLLGLAMPWVLEYFNDTYDLPHDLEKQIGLPVLGTVPARSALDYAAWLGVGGNGSNGSAKGTSGSSGGTSGGSGGSVGKESKDGNGSSKAATADRGATANDRDRVR